MDAIISNLDLILCVAATLIAVIVLARRGQIALLRELISSLAENADLDAIYAALPRTTRLLVSAKTLEKMMREE